MTERRKQGGPRKVCGTPCWLRFTHEHPSHAVRYDFVREAVRRFDRIARFLARFGVRVEATIHFGETREAATSSPPARRLIS